MISTPGPEARRSEVPAEKFEAMVERGRSGSCLVGADGRITYANAAFAELVQRPAAEVVGATNAELFPADVAKRLSSIDRDLLESGGESESEESIPTAAGTCTWACRRFPVDGGEGLEIAGIFAELSAGRRAEERARMNALLLDQFDAAMVATDAEQRITQWSRGAERMYGWSREEAVGRTSLELGLLKPDEAAALSAHQQRALGGEGLSTELEMQPRRGPPRTVLHELSPLREAGGGKVVGTADVSVDVTDRKRAEVQLSMRADQQSAVARLGRGALLGMPIAELFEDAVREIHTTLGIELVKILELEPAGKDLLPRAAIGWDPELTRAARIGVDDSHAGLALTSADPVVVEDIGGESRFQQSALLRAHAVLSGVAVAVRGDGTPYGAITVHSRRHRRFTVEEVQFVEAIAHVLGAALARQRAEQLEVRVQQEQRLEAVGELAGGMAHDFNNLLGIILNYTSFARDAAPAGSTMRDDLSEVLKAADSAAGLTRSLLVFSRRDVFQHKVVAINAAIEEMLAMLRKTVGEDVALVTELDPSLPSVKIGDGQVQQVLVNLAVNARDAMPAGGTLRIETTQVDLDPIATGGKATLRPGPYVRLTVQDDGAGMGKEALAHAFEPFFSTKPPGQGTGLGLGVVHGIARQAGGEASMESELGVGTTATVHLPLSSASASDAGAFEEAPTEGAETAQGGGETVLVVDDYSNLRQLAARILEEAGYDVEAVASGDEALAHVEAAGPPQLLLTDVVMPGMSGPVLAERLRRSHRDMPVAYMSGYAGDVISHHGVREDQAILIEKPFTAAELLKTVRAALSAHTAA
jgi:PAS domain S-box-containing protein